MSVDVNTTVVGLIPNRGNDLLSSPNSVNKTNKALFHHSTRIVSKIGWCVENGVSGHWVPSACPAICKMRREDKINYKLILY